VGLYIAFMRTPWGTAYITTTLKKYLESDWYKERSQLFVKRRAFEMYFDHDESWFFKRRISLKEKIGIFFTPYSYIRSAQEAVYDNGLIDYV
jgi:hypothetical protein